MHFSKSKILSAALLATVSINVMGAHAVSETPVSIIPILDTTKAWDNETLPHNTRVNIKEFTIQPGATIPVHKHLVNGGGYILDGELTMFVTHDKNGSFNDPALVTEITLQAGKTWAETVDTWHYGVNNGTKPVKFIVTFIGDADTPQTAPFEQK